MKTIMQKYEIIRLKKEGWSDNRISKTFGVSRNTIRKYWKSYCSNLDELLKLDPNVDTRKVIETLIDDPSYDSSKRTARKYSEEMDIQLRKILADEENKTRLLGPGHKQALNDRQIYQLLINQGFDIGETTIRNRLRVIRDEKKEAFIKQKYDYCDRFEYDFGEVRLIIDGRNIKGYLAVLVCPASGFRWAYLYRNSKMDVFLDSHVRFFEMLGGSFKEGVYDNMKNVVARFIGKNEKQLNEQLIKLALYYDFTINVTNCFSGNEKGTVESAVKWIRNQVFAYKYAFDTFENACDYLQEKLVEINKNSNIEEEKKHLKPYRPRYETARITKNRVDKYSFVHIDNNCYSVPEDLCQKWVIAKLYPNDLIIMYKQEIVARHARIAGKGKTRIDIRHYLHTFSRKPGSLSNSLALKSEPELKNMFNKYYKEKPKVFIEILRRYSDSDLKTLLEALEPRQQEAKIQQAVDDKTMEQINELCEMFIGGNQYVH